jgi:hypothetical protein
MRLGRRIGMGVGQHVGGNCRYNQMPGTRIATCQLFLPDPTILRTWPIAKRGISKQTSESTRAKDICSASV